MGFKNLVENVTSAAVAFKSPAHPFLIFKILNWYSNFELVDNLIEISNFQPLISAKVPISKTKLNFKERPIYYVISNPNR